VIANFPSINQKPVALKPTVVAPDMKFTGQISSGGLLSIHGAINGETTCDQSFLAEGANFKGVLNAKTAVLAGVFDGEIRSHEVVLKATSVVHGVIICQKIFVEDGAIINAKITMKLLSD